MGLAIADPGDGSSLLFFHATPSLTGSPTAADFKNSASWAVRALTPFVDDASPAWSSHALGFRVILDDGAHRLALCLARDPLTRARLVRVENAPGAAALGFHWDNDFHNTFEIARKSNGDFVVTLTSGDSTATTPVVSQTYAAASLPPSAGTPMFAWGMGPAGGGLAFFQSARAEVHSAEQLLKSLVLRDVQIRSHSVNERVKVSADFVLPDGATVDPSTQEVTLALRRPAEAAAFWPAQGIAPLHGFVFDGIDKYSLSPSEKQRTGLESLDLKKGWSLNCVDTRSSVPVGGFDQVLVELRIGEVVGFQLASLMESPAGSGSWKLR